MRRLRPTVALSLALLLALRAFVPVGYMLTLPVAGDGNVALTSCSTQNPGLDLDLLAARDAGGHAHHAHAHHGAGPSSHEGAPEAVEISGACGLWLASAAPAAPANVVAATASAPADHLPARGATSEPTRAPRGHALTRAPPLTG